MNKNNSKDKESEENNKEKEKSRSNFRNILNGVLKVTMFGLIAIMVIIIIRILVFHKSDIFGYKFYIIRSGSMDPTIQVLDAVMTKETDNISLGDIVAINDSNSIVVHRIVEVDTQNDEEVYMTKGDNNNTIDGRYIGKSNIEGRVVFIVPKVGKVIMFLKSHLIIFVYIIAVIISIILVRRLI